MTRREMSPVGEVIRLGMHRIGVTQRELSALTGIDGATLSRFASGDREPKREQVATLAKHLNLSNHQSDLLFVRAGYCTDQMRKEVIDRGDFDDEEL